METKFERKIYQKLLSWKAKNESGSKTALVIKGARQVGKTFTVLEFAKKEYENFVYINFHTSNEYNQYFEGNLDTDTLIAKLTSKNEFNFVPNKTLIIFDEIQECERARTSLKPFCLDGRFDVIATGSLLGVSGFNRNPKASISVGYETHITMHPMDFKEYLWAIGFNKQTLSKLESNVYDITPVDSFFHNQLLNEYKDYMIVGGMPRAVQEFIETKNFNSVKAVQRSIVSAYRDDFGKYTNSLDKTVINNRDSIKLKKVYDSIPIQLSREENTKNKNSSTKFRFSDVTSGGKFRDYVDAIDWLSEAGVINVCYNTSSIMSPINAYKIENQFKIYLNDTGLLFSLLTNDITSAVYQSTNNIYKGYIYENLIADALSKNDVPLFYNATNSDQTLEIDFLIPTNSGLLATEVKASNNPSASLKKVIKKENVKGIKLSRNNIGYMNNILSIPYYFAYLIDEEFIYPDAKYK